MGVSASEAAEEMRLGALVRLLVLLSLELLESDSINHFPSFSTSINHFWYVFSILPPKWLIEMKKCSCSESTGDNLLVIPKLPINYIILCSSFSGKLLETVGA